MSSAKPKLSREPEGMDVEYDTDIKSERCEGGCVLEECRKRKKS
jgi:hypothetical protein